MAIMITGATGFLGSHLAHYLVEEQGQREVVLLDRYPNFGRIERIRKHVAVVEADIQEQHEVLDAMQKHNVDQVVHLAFIAGVEEYGKALPYLQFQCMGTAMVFECARLHGIKRVVNASSHAVYGRRTDGIPVHEDEPVRTGGQLYGACKVWTENVAENYNTRYGMEIISLRLNSAYGIGRVGRGASWAGGLLDLDRRSLNYKANVELAMLGQPVIMPPDERMDDFLHASDTAQACWLAVSAETPKHRIFNVGNEHRPVGDYTRIMRELVPNAEISTEDEGRQFILLDSSRIRAELGFKPRYSLETGLAAYVEQIKRDLATSP